MASIDIIYLHLNSGNEKKVSSITGLSRSLKFAMIVGILAFPIITLIAFYSSLNIVATNAPLFNFLNLGSSKGAYSVTTENFTQITVVINSSAIQNSLKFPNFFPIISVPGEYLVIAIIIIFLLVGIGVVRNVRQQNTVTGFDETKGVEIQRNEVANVLDDAVSELRSGNEYRKTVLECYRRVSKLLEAKSSIDGNPLTAREFGKAVSTSLKLNSPYLTQVTEIFEKARYSRVEISKESADMAIESLTKLSDLLRDMNSQIA